MDNIRKYLDIEVINKYGINGKDITVAVLDTGIEKHPDLDGRIVAFKDIINGKKECYDDNGHGTHIAGIIAGNGVKSKGIIKGIAPEANIVSVKVLNFKGMGNEDNVAEGIHWIIDNKIKYNIRIVNISFGTTLDKEACESKMMQAVDLMWDTGLIVVAAAGNNGPSSGSITAPGCSRKVITVGALDDGKKVSVNGKYISNYSGRGPTVDCIQKPDVIAPANNIKSCNNRFFEKSYTIKSGTSMAAPVVTGAIALALQQNKHLTNFDIKNFLRKTSIDKGQPANVQGWGMINPKGIYRTIEDSNKLK